MGDGGSRLLRSGLRRIRAVAPALTLLGALLARPASAQNLFACRLYPLSGVSYSGAGATADFDSDGRPDIATANDASDDVSVVFGDGTGGFGAALLLDAGDGPVAITAGDLDGDGAADIATANQLSNDVVVLLGAGDGTFGPATSLAVGLHPQDLVASDLNGDGHLDLVTADAWSMQVSALLNDGTGSFAPAQPSSTVSDQPLKVGAGDFDADGDIDLVYTVYGDILHLFPGDGSGGFSTPIYLYAYGGDVTVADANMDGHLDVLAPSGADSYSVTLLAGTAGGGFDPAVYIPTKAVPAFVTIADVSGDGLPDLLTADSSSWPAFSAGVSVLLAYAPAHFGPANSISAGGGNHFVAPLDMDEDGWPDLVSPSGSSVVVVLAEGAGQFDEVFGVYSPLEGVTDLELVDLDSNGLPDLVSCSWNSWLIVQLATAEAAFGPAGFVPTGGLSPGFALGDLDGDALVDAVAFHVDGTLSVLDGDGLGGFTPAGNHPV